MFRTVCRSLSRSRKWPTMEEDGVPSRTASAFFSTCQQRAVLPWNLQAQPRSQVLRSVGKQSSLSSFFTKEAMSVRRIIEDRRWDAQVESSLTSCSISFCEGLVVEVIKSLSEAKHALRFFIWMQQQPRLRHLCLLETAVAVLSRRWSHEKQFSLFLRALHLDLQAMTTESFRTLLMGYGWAGMIDKAVETLESMPSLGVLPRFDHFMCVLDILDQEKLFYALQRVRDKMHEVGVYPGKEMYDKLIWGLCVAGHKEEALNLFEEMQGRGEKPGLETYRILISMFSKADQSLPVLRVLNDFLADGFEPDVKAFNALIKALCLAGKTDEALEAMQMMLDKPLNPNLVSLTMVTDGLLKMGNIDKVLGLWIKLNKNMITTVTFEERLLSELRKAGRMAEVEKVMAAKNLRTAEAEKVSASKKVKGQANIIHKTTP